MIHPNGKEVDVINDNMEFNDGGLGEIEKVKVDRIHNYFYNL